MWECQKCHERIEPNFDVCWNCGTSKTGVEHPEFRTCAPSAEEQAEEEASARESAAPFVEPPRLVCGKCGAKEVVAGVRVADNDGEWGQKSLSLRQDRNPGALLFKGIVLIEVRANVCRTCGFVELYATNPEALLTENS